MESKNNGREFGRIMYVGEWNSNWPDSVLNEDGTGHLLHWRHLVSFMQDDAQITGPNGGVQHTWGDFCKPHRCGMKCQRNNNNNNNNNGEKNRSTLWKVDGGKKAGVGLDRRLMQKKGRFR